MRILQIDYIGMKRENFCAPQTGRLQFFGMIEILQVGDI